MSVSGTLTGQGLQVGLLNLTLKLGQCTCYEGIMLITLTIIRTSKNIMHQRRCEEQNCCDLGQKNEAISLYVQI